MPVRSAAELRIAAEEFRQMATEGDDPRLKDALLLVADEFEQEAAATEGNDAGKSRSEGAA